MKDVEVLLQQSVKHLGLVAADQAALDGGRWHIAGLLTLQPEPPWSEISRPPAAQANAEGFSELCDPGLMTTAVAKLKILPSSWSLTPPPRQPRTSLDWSEASSCPPINRSKTTSSPSPCRG